MVASFAVWLKELGHTRVILQSDGEPDAVRARFIKENGEVQQVSVQASPRHSHQSNGGAERAISTLRGIARVFLLHMVGKVACLSCQLTLPGGLGSSGMPPGPITGSTGGGTEGPPIPG